MSLSESHGFLIILGPAMQLAFLSLLLTVQLLAGSLIQLPLEKRAGWEGRVSTRLLRKARALSSGLPFPLWV